MNYNEQNRRELSIKIDMLTDLFHSDISTLSKIIILKEIEDLMDKLYKTEKELSLKNIRK